MIDPDLYYQLWKQEHGERIRTAGRRQAVREAMLTKVGGRSGEMEGLAPTHKNWLALLGEGVLRLRRLWTAS